MSGWVTIWDVAAEPFRWGGAGEGLWALSSVFMGIASAGALRRRSGTGAAVALAIAGAVAALLLWVSLDHHREHTACAEASRTNAGRVLEGVVRDVHPLVSFWQYPAEETFTLAGEPVRIPLVAEGCGYHLASTDASGIREGVRVRLHAWRGQILRVEVDRDALLGIVDASRER